MNENIAVEFSQEIGELAKALAAAQGAMNNAKKSSDNPFFKSKYADLAEVWDTCREPLAKNNLAIIQMPGEIDAQGNIKITTMLTHSSSQWIKSTMNIKVAKLDAQGIGSAITYGRRYALAAMVGIAQEDDDGESAVGRNNKQTKSEPKAKSEPAQVEYVRNKDGVTEVLGNNNKWYALENMLASQLQSVINDPKYAKCHNEARRLLGERKGA